jgi:HSP20 family protein
MSSFFKRLARNLIPDTSELESSDEVFEETHHHLADTLGPINTEEEDDVDGELAVDVYDDGDAVYVKTMTAGVRKEDLEITLSRERVTIRGSRYDDHSPADEFYVHQELYWGTFARTIELPEEVDIDHAEATEQHGLLTLRLPKVDKYREAQVAVK